MDPMKRKLFQSRDARDKLRAQGGITASFPKLAETVAKFANGGLTEVPGYLDSGRAEVDPRNRARNLDLIASLNQSAKGAEFADWLNSVGQAGVDAVTAAMRKIGGSGIQVDAELSMAMSMAAAALGFPEKASQWRKEARREMLYGTAMVEDKIDLLGRPRETQFQLPDSARQMYALADVNRKLEAAGPESALVAEGSVAEPLNGFSDSIIQARRMPSPDVMTDLPSFSLLSETPSSVGVIPTSETTPQRAAQTRNLPFVDSSATSLSVRPMPQGDAAMAPEKYRPFQDSQTADVGGLRGPITADELAAQLVGVNPSYSEAESAVMAEARLNERLAQQDAERLAAETVGAKIASDQPEKPVPLIERLVREAARNLGEFNRRPPGMDTATEDVTELSLEELLPPAAGGTETPAAGGTENPAAGGTETPATGGTETPDAGGGGDFDTTFDQMLSRLEVIVGEDSDEDKKKQAMANLAMIGLAIAAGQSPDALTNIAQGALAGIKGIQAAKAEEKKTKTALRLKAAELANAREIALIRSAGTDGKGRYSWDRLRDILIGEISKNKYDYTSLMKVDEQGKVTGELDTAKVNAYLQSFKDLREGIVAPSEDLLSEEERLRKLPPATGG